MLFNHQIIRPTDHTTRTECVCVHKSNGHSCAPMVGTRYERPEKCSIQIGSSSRGTTVSGTAQGGLVQASTTTGHQSSPKYRTVCVYVCWQRKWLPTSWNDNWFESMKDTGTFEIGDWVTVFWNHGGGVEEQAVGFMLGLIPATHCRAMKTQLLETFGEAYLVCNKYAHNKRNNSLGYEIALPPQPRVKYDLKTWSKQQPTRQTEHLGVPRSISTSHGLPPTDRTPCLNYCNSAPVRHAKNVKMPLKHL